jgi:hypothetical protein
MGSQSEVWAKSSCGRSAPLGIGTEVVVGSDEIRQTIRSLHSSTSVERALTWSFFPLNPRLCCSSFQSLTCSCLFSPTPCPRPPLLARAVDSSSPTTCRLNTTTHSLSAAAVTCAVALRIWISTYQACFPCPWTLWNRTALQEHSAPLGFKPQGFPLPATRISGLFSALFFCFPDLQP